MADNFTDQIAAFDPSQGLSIEVGAIDETAGTIKGVSLATAGVEAIGHGKEEGEVYREFWTDAETLHTMLDACLSIGEPLKVKMEHKSGLMEVVGTFDNFRIDGDNLRADFTAIDDPEKNDLVRHLMKLARKIPKQFGISVVALMARLRSNAIDLMRVYEVSSADFVEKPAINAALFSQNKRLDKASTVSTNSLQMDEAQIKTMMEGIMSPITERLSALEEGMKPNEEKLAAEEAAKEEMSKKLTETETELSAVKSELTALSKVAEDAKALGVRFGAQLSAAEESGQKETFTDALNAKRKDGKADHVAIAELRSEKRELCELEAKQRGLPSINML